MLLNLREIINIPGKSVSFDYEPELGDAAAFGSVTGVLKGARAVGAARNSAGVLELTAELTATMTCVCARCLKEFTYPVRELLSATLSETVSEDDEADLYPLDGDCVDVDTIIVTEFVLGLEQRMLCSEDCKGICDQCGADLNDGPCNCVAEVDPRLSVLGQLLENE